MNYQSFDQLQSAGWTSEHPVGVSFGSVGVVLDQTHGDTAIHYIGHFASGIYDWKVEDQSRWVSGSHSRNDVSAITEKHNYAFAADGWYSQFAFYHDGSKVYTSQKGTYSESKNTLFTLSMVKIGTQINCYYNGQLKYTYIESDSTPSQLNGVDAVSPWGGSSEYDYFQLSSASVFPSPVSPQSNNILSNPFVIGGIIGVVGIGVGLGVYFGFVAGGGAASSAGAASASIATGEAGSVGASAGSGGTGSGGGGTSGSNHHSETDNAPNDNPSDENPDEDLTPEQIETLCQEAEKPDENPDDNPSDDTPDDNPDDTPEYNPWDEPDYNPSANEEEGGEDPEPGEGGESDL